MHFGHGSRDDSYYFRNSPNVSAQVGGNYPQSKGDEAVVGINDSGLLGA